MRSRRILVAGAAIGATALALSACAPPADEGNGNDGGDSTATIAVSVGPNDFISYNGFTPETYSTYNSAIADQLKVGFTYFGPDGAVVLPTVPPGPDYDPEHFTVRSIFLDGSEPVEFLGRIIEFAALPRPLPAEAEQALTRLRRGWHLLSPEEELVHAQDMVARYAHALEAMTESRDLYREAAEAAQAALAEAARGAGAPRPAVPGPAGEEGAPFSGLTKAFARFKGTNK